MKDGRQKITADKILDLYDTAKKQKVIKKKEEIMRRVVYLSQHLNEFMVIK